MSQSQQRNATAVISLGIAVLVLLLKLGAYWLTGSVALLSDAAESVVNVAAGLAVIFSIRLAQRPPDYEHPYGHQKAEYFSSAFEGSLILLAAGMILVTAMQRLFDPPALSSMTEGLGIALLAMLINGLAAWYIAREGRRSNSAALAANARHILTDVWTSVGVVLAVVLVWLSGWMVLDPVIAIVVALNIIREGWRVLTSSLSSLMDARLPDGEERIILDLLNAHPEVLGYHRLRTRSSGRRRFAEFDIFVDPDLSVFQAHELVAALEDQICNELPDLITTVHVEPYIKGKREGSSSPVDEFGVSAK